MLTNPWHLSVLPRHPSKRGSGSSFLRKLSLRVVHFELRNGTKIYGINVCKL